MQNLLPFILFSAKRNSLPFFLFDCSSREREKAAQSFFFSRLETVWWTFIFYTFTKLMNFIRKDMHPVKKLVTSLKVLEKLQGKSADILVLSIYNMCSIFQHDRFNYLPGYHGWKWKIIRTPRVERIIVEPLPKKKKKKVTLNQVTVRAKKRKRKKRRQLKNGENFSHFRLFILVYLCLREYGGETEFTWRSGRWMFNKTRGGGHQLWIYTQMQEKKGPENWKTLLSIWSIGRPRSLGGNWKKSFTPLVSPRKN